MRSCPLEHCRSNGTEMVPVEEEGGGWSGADWRRCIDGGRGERGTDCFVFNEDVRALVRLEGSKKC